MKKMHFGNMQLISYLFWCIMTTAVSWITYSIFVNALEFTNINSLTAISISNVLSWICAVTFSFVANKKLVFRSKSWKLAVVLPELLKFFSTRLAVGLLEIVLVPVAVSLGLNQPLFGVDGMLSKVIVILISN